VLKNIYLICGISFIGIITFLSLKESFSFTVNLFSFTDKIFHMGAYVVLTFFWGRYLMLLKPDLSMKKALIIVATLLLLYGIIIEVLQTELTKNRVGEFEDVIANILGILIGAIVFRYIIKWKINYNKGLFF
jgi:VanZ family protein